MPALEILEERLAKGEITSDEFKKLKNELTGQKGSSPKGNGTLWGLVFIGLAIGCFFVWSIPFMDGFSRGSSETNLLIGAIFGFGPLFFLLGISGMFLFGKK